MPTPIAAPATSSKAIISAINVDAALRYQINRNFEVSLEGINLTDAYRDRFTDIDANRNYENNHFGRTLIAGVRFRL